MICTPEPGSTILERDRVHAMVEREEWEYLSSLVLETREQLVEHVIPAIEDGRKIPRRGGTAWVVDSMQGCNQCGQERFEEFDEEGLDGVQEIVDVGELEDALIGDLGERERARVKEEVEDGGGTRDERTTNMSSRSLTNVHLTEHPSFS